MSFITSVFYFFTPYTDARERAVAVFFRGLTERSSQSKIRERLGHLLQRDIAAINLWTEYRYKGYRYLRKSQRKKLYANLQRIADDFDRFYESHIRSAEAVVNHIHRLAPHAAIDPEKARCLQALNDYFSPGRGMYEYRESSSFGRLLRDPTHEKLIGDCNQIVTLYMYLYARYHDLRDLQLRILPEHVALHYGGIDVETTTGTFASYDGKAGGALLPVEEIVSINLLDTTDSYLATHEVAPEDLLQASRLAFILSHDRDVVTHNLDAAYKRLINALMERNNYRRALEFAVASRDMTLLSVVGHNGAVYEMQQHNYAAARRFAQHAMDHDELIRSTWQAEGAHYYQTQHYHDAIKAFKQLNDQTLIRQCYEALFFEEQEKLGSDLTTDSIKRHASTVKRMHSYAKKSGNKELIKYTDSLKKYT